MPTFRIREHVRETKVGSLYYEVTAKNSDDAIAQVKQGVVNNVDGELYTRQYDAEIMECEEL